MAVIEDSGVPNSFRKPPKKRYVNGKLVDVKDPSQAPEQPDELEAKTPDEVKYKLMNKITRNSYLDLESAIYGILNVDEIKIALESDLVSDKDLQILIKKRKSILLNEVVRQGVKNGKTADTYRLLVDSDKDRAKLNTRTEVKEDTNKGKQIRIIHKTQED